MTSKGTKGNGRGRGDKGVSEGKIVSSERTEARTATRRARPRRREVPESRPPVKVVLRAEEKTESLAKKPAKGGMPSKENKPTKKRVLRRIEALPPRRARSMVARAMRRR